MKYFDELKRSMDWLGSKKETIFMGQAVACPGTGISNTLKDVPKDKLLELPVAEEMQMGMTLGMSFEKVIPISIFPRWNFVLCGINQLVNHIDKLPEMGENKFKSNIIIRTSIGSERPLHPQHQHVGDFTKGFELICDNINFVKLDEPEQIFPAYQQAYLKNDNIATVLIEYGDFYNEK
jgi:pyruvate/2-oxoglutarate/acetoin dehydrogenase E1 component